MKTAYVSASGGRFETLEAAVADVEAVNGVEVRRGWWLVDHGNQYGNQRVEPVDSYRAGELLCVERWGARVTGPDGSYPYPWVLAFPYVDGYGEWQADEDTEAKARAAALTCAVVEDLDD